MNQPITFLQHMQQLFSSGVTPDEIEKEVEAEAARVAADAEIERLARAAEAAQIAAAKQVRVVTSEIIAAACIRNGMSQEECDVAIEAVFIRRGE